MSCGRAGAPVYDKRDCVSKTDNASAVSQMAGAFLQPGRVFT